MKIKHGLAQKIWINICRIFVKSFYYQVQIRNADILTQNRPIIICANHSNALADAVLLQYCTNKLVQPVARSGLFKNPFIRIILNIWQAIPVYRRQDAADNNIDNSAMFSKVISTLNKNAVIMIFPEGQSHSEPQLKEIKTGVSRIILSYKKEYDASPVVVAAGLNFSDKTRFRSNVFITFSDAISINPALNIDNEKDVRDLTVTIQQKMSDQIIEADNRDDLLFADHVDRFFTLRHKKYRKKNLQQKFNSKKLLLKIKNYLNKNTPAKLEQFHRHLNQFNRLCSNLGVTDYSLNIRYTNKLIVIFILKSLLSIFFILPLGILGLIYSFVPYYLTLILTRVFSRGEDQYDTAKIMTGSVIFPLYWSIQSWQLYLVLEPVYFTIYIVSILPASLLTWVIFKQQARIMDDLKVFFVLINNKRIRRFLLKKRRKLEKEMADLLRIARKHKQL